MKCHGYHKHPKHRRPEWKEPKVIIPDEIDRIRDEIAAEHVIPTTARPKKKGRVLDPAPSAK